ncbi:AMP-binding protein [Saccharopolyspora sp. HNM0986]|uniref:AMP-dependent synthetase/ligase n=1 Tax=Saccharopolyspora galaxeae TaxID=2781241 RepID=UPI00190D1EDD|nr:AMP-binding protein [Saccharopolyspora sp. HNM0986]MBK0870473.1 AMP-binding protein [Saccharopolyspora sp. HNM0986]
MDAFAESAAPLTVPRLFGRNAAEHPDRPALTAGDRTWTWGEAEREVRSLAAGFAALGLRPGQTAVLMMSNRPEQWLADAALAHLGAVPVAVAPALSTGDVGHVARHSRARLLLLENAQHVRRSAAALRDAEGLEHVVVLDEQAIPDEDRRFRSWDALRAGGERLLAEDPGLVRRHADDVGPDDPVTVSYSQDPLGQQTGVVLTHRNVLAAADARHRLTGAQPHSRTVCSLPMAHMAERATSLYSAIHDIAHVHFCNGIGEVVDALPDIRPHTLVGVPRLWERLAAKLRASADGHDPLAKIGLDATTWAASGSAPLNREVPELFAASGLEIFECWGLTETAGWTASGSPGSTRPGTAGRPLPGVQVRAEDGELLVRGPMVCAGRLEDDGVIRSITDSGGWLRTGDAGSVDADGFLSITGRKDELIVDADGQHVSPDVVENALRAHPLIGHALVFGNGRPHLVALLVLDEEAAPEWARQHGIDGTSPAELARHPEVLAEVDRAVGAANSWLDASGQVRGHRLLDRTWGAEGGELGPSMRLRRHAIHDKYAEVLESLYS